MSNQNSAALHNAWDGTTKLQGPLCLCPSIHLMTENAIIEVNNHVVFCLSTAPTTAHRLINTDNAFPGQSVCSTVQKKRQRISNGPLIRTDAFLSLVITVVNPIDLLRSTYTYCTIRSSSGGGDRFVDTLYIRQIILSWSQYTLTTREENGLK